MKKSLILMLSVSFVLFFFGTIIYVNKNKQIITYKDYVEWKKEQKKSNNPKPGYPDKALQWFYEQRAYPNGTIPENWREEALKHIKENNINEEFLQSPNALTWQQLGPGNIGGRIRAILVHPSNSNILYIGSVSGGVWKTTNGGTSWFPLKDDMENLAVCALAFDPSNPNIIYAGTGEGFFNLDAVRGAGIFKSTDAGSTWTQLSATNNSNFYYVNKLVFDNTNNTLWAATRKGLFKTTNGGTSFTTVLSNSGQDVHCMDVEVAYTSPTTIYASFGLFNQSSVYRSTDAGNNFSQNASVNGMGRIELAVSSSNPLVAYASYMSLSTYGIGAFQQTTNGGNSWFDRTVAGPSYSGASTYAGGQGWYDNIVYVDPGNSSIVYAGGIDFWKSTNSGSGWTQKTNWYVQSGAPPYVHADHHAVAFDPQNQNVLYLGTDGGIFKSTNKGDTWTSLNNQLYITQFYYGAVNPSGTTYYGGTQDNGTLKSTGSTSWNEIFGGDGGATEVDFTNTNNIYIEYVNWAFFKSTNGGVTFFKAMNGVPTGSGTYDGTTDRTLFITPFSMDPNNSSNLVAGTYRVWRTTNSASSWTAISSDLTGDGSGSSGATISTVIVAKGNSNVIYVGCSNGRVQVTTNAGSNWNLRNSGLPNLYATRIATDAADPAVAFVTYSGFSSGQKVYKTTNYGVNWTNISGNLPNIPVSSILVNPTNNNHILVGTDLGVFSTTNGGTTWVQDNNGLANVVVSDLDYRSSDGKVFAATHGRSMYSATLTTGGGGTVTTELIYDDGTPQSGYYWPQLGQGSANRLTPTLSNAKLITVKIYITGSNSGTYVYRPLILSSSSGAPGSQLATLNFKTSSTANGWDETDVTSLNITVNSDFFVGIQYNGVDRPTFGYDPFNNGRAWDFNGTSWSQWNETYFMRGVIQSTTTSVEIDNIIPSAFNLYQNYPNPFNPTTTIKFALPFEEKVTLFVYNINGEKVAELVNNELAPGTYNISWNGKNDAGEFTASGIYFYKLKAGKNEVTKKMMLLR